MTLRRDLLALAAVSCLLLSGCKSKNTSGTGSQPVLSAPQKGDALIDEPRVDPSTVGSVSGTIELKGTPPARVSIDMSMDPACSLAGKNLTEQYVVDHGKLANVFVYIKSGLPAKSAPPSTAPVTIDQHGCRFVPHVAAVQQGGEVRFTNSDPTMHNIHTLTLGSNPSIDVSQGPGAQPQLRRFTSPEMMIALRCNNHPWMNAFLNVAPNAFFAVTAPDGTFKIAGLPPGTYTLAAVHEKLGEQDTEVTVKAQESAKAHLTFTMH